MARNTKLVLAALIITVAAANSILADDVLVLHADSGSMRGGTLSLLDGGNLSLSTSIDAITDPARGDYGGDGFLGIQSDGTIVSLINDDTPGNFGIFSWVGNGVYVRRDPATLATLGDEEGIGSPGTALGIFPDDRVFIGARTVPTQIANIQVRIPDLTRITSTALGEPNGGPGQFGDEVSNNMTEIGLGIQDVITQSDNDSVFLYQFTEIPCMDPCPGSHGRIRRAVNGDLVNSGGDEGLGSRIEGMDTLANFGLLLEQQSDDTIVLAKDDRIVELRHADTLSPDLGGFAVSSGQLGTNASVSVTALGVLSNDHVVIGTSEGELQLRDGSDLTAINSLFLEGMAPGTFEITSLAIQSDDDVIVGTATGELYRFNSSLVQQGPTMTGFENIADLLIIPGDDPVVDCDFNDDTACDGTDINMLTAEIAAGTDGGAFDLTEDGNVDLADQTAWLDEAGNMNIGAAYLDADFDLDGNVNGQDFVIWNTNKFTSNTDWTAGNANGDMDVNGQDFVIWNTNKFMSSDVSAVPEPATCALLFGMIACLFHCRWRS